MRREKQKRVVRRVGMMGHEFCGEHETCMSRDGGVVYRDDWHLRGAHGWVCTIRGVQRQ